MKPTFQVIADQKDITALIADRVLSIRTTDKTGIDSDECEITLDDRDGKIAFPRKGATLDVSLGWVGGKLHFIGKYTVDEIEISGPPQTIIIRGKPANIAASIKEQKWYSWENVKLSDIVGDIARRNKLKPLCTVEVSIQRKDQVNESDMNFITRLALEHDATATVKDGKLIVAPRGEGKSGSGKPLPEIIIHKDDLSDYSFTFPDRSIFGASAASWHNNKTGKKITYTMPNPDAPAGVDAPTHSARHICPSKEAAEAVAKGNLKKLNRATMTGTATLYRGRPDVGADKWVKFEGIKQELDGTYLIESVEHRYSKSGWITSLKISAGNGGKGKIGREKKTYTMPAPS